MWILRVGWRFTTMTSITMTSISVQCARQPTNIRHKIVQIIHSHIVIVNLLLTGACHFSFCFRLKRFVAPIQSCSKVSRCLGNGHGWHVAVQVIFCYFILPKHAIVTKIITHTYVTQSRNGRQYIGMRVSSSSLADGTILVIFWWRKCKQRRLNDKVLTSVNLLPAN